MSLVLYVGVAVCGLGLLTLSFASNRGRRNAGFASKMQVKKHLSAKAVLRASEIRPSLAAARVRSRPATEHTAATRPHTH
ncbi:hypothetical protein SMD44_p20030 (plasmid) [Streptomyces alboflavus]|uniref:Uncharacterized protein n=1 Tax=Streptomyces alboflavus TaxID=67267 RepID=A0A291W4H7_9ACTN|nr:hypothetical protein SMD44_p20030 [Streptomyces alboflavus]